MPTAHKDMIDVAIQIIDEAGGDAAAQSLHVLQQLAKLAEMTLERASGDSTVRRNLRMIETLAVEMAYRLKAD